MTRKEQYMAIVRTMVKHYAETLRTAATVGDWWLMDVAGARLNSFKEEEWRLVREMNRGNV